MECKKIFLILILFLLTSCSNNYELKIDKSKIKENVHFTLKDTDYKKANAINEVFNVTTDYYDNESKMGEHIINTIRNDKFVALYETGEIYEKTINNNKIDLSYNFDSNDFASSNIFNSCFGDTYYDITDDYYLMKGYNSFKCLIEDKVSISIETDYKVIRSNADKIRGNKYIWYFDRENNLDHELYIQVSRLYKSKKQNYYLLIIMTVLVLGIVIYKFKNSNIFKFKANNEI